MPKFYWPWENPFDEDNRIPSNPSGKLPSVVHAAVVTRRGRVVYDRRFHPFTEADLRRITGNVLQVNRKFDDQWDYLDMLDKMTIFMLEKILERAMSQFAAKILSERLFYIAHYFLARILDKLSNEDRLKLVGEFDPGGIK